MSTHKEQTLEPTPSLQTILAQYGELSLQKYAQQEYCGVVSNDRDFLSKKQEFLELLGQYTEEKFGIEMARIVTDSLEKNYCVSTGDHQGPMGHPFFFHSAILRGLIRPQEAVINISTSHVSLGNSSYPRGIVFHGDTDKAGNEYLHLPFFSSGHRMSPLYGFPAYSSGNIYNYTIPKLLSYTKEGKISESQNEKILTFLENIILSKTLLDLPTYSDQCTVLNFHWWKDIFQDFPPFVGIDNEDFIRFLLLKHFDEKSDFVSMFFSPEMQGEIETSFDGIGCCFGRNEKRGTYLFWHLDKNHKRHALWRNGNMLVSNDGTFGVSLDPTALSIALTNNALIPSGLLSYGLLVCYYHLTSFGGIFQAEYLTQIQRKYYKLSTLSSHEKSYAKTDIINADLYFLFTRGGQALSALDFTMGDIQGDIFKQARETSLEKAIKTCMSDF